MNSIVFIDSQITDYEAIIAGLGPDVDWALLQANQDGLEQIRTVLTSRSQLASVHIISHGSAGQLYLGSTALNVGNLPIYAETLQAIGQSLTDTGDLLLYGCNVADGESGRAFVEELSRLTGADVAASTDLTGSAVRGGNWVLERSAGSVEAVGIAAEFYRGVLGVVDGTTGDDVLVGVDAINGDTINGFGGNDSIAGLVGNDRIDAGAGNDTVDGDAGNDLIIGNEGDDSLLGGDGNDTILGGGGYTTNTPTTIQTDSDTIDGGVGDDAIYGELGNDILYGDVGNDTIDGEAGNDVLFGEDGNDSLIGNDGDDSLLGGEGDDTLVGGAGKDTIWGEVGTDMVYGGDGDDVIHGAVGNDTLQGDAGNDVLFGEADDDSITGGAGQDILLGDDGNDVLAGGDDNDSIDGGAGNDTLYGDAGDDVLTDTQGSNDLHGGLGADRLTASGTSAGLWGDEGDDILQANALTLAILDGGEGNDTLIANGVTNAALTGGAGVDRFVLTAQQAGKTITITDFATGVGGDVLEYSDLLRNGTAGAYPGGDPFASGFLKWEQSGADTLLQFDANGLTGGSTWTTLATLQNVTVLNLVKSSNFTTTANNTAPVAADTLPLATEDVPLSASVSATDMEGNVLTYTLVSQVNHGVLLFNSNGSYTYTPDANYNGSDSFTFKANDGLLDSTMSTVNIRVAAVNDAPVATGESQVFNEDDSVTGFVDARDADGDVLSYRVVSGPSHGVMEFSPSGLYTYRPNANYSGSDSFTFEASDGVATSNVATVAFTINPVNDKPEAANASLATQENTTLNVKLLAGDVENSPLTYTLVSQPQWGTLTFKATGEYAYTPKLNYNGTDSFKFKVNDGASDSNEATVEIQVYDTNNAPVAVPAGLVMNEDGDPLKGQVQANDVDANTKLVYSVTTQPAHGTLAFSSDGNYTYIPDANYNGTDAFAFKANDGIADSAPVVISIVVKPVNDAPVAGNGLAVTNEDTPYTGLLIMSDAEGDVLTYSVEQSPSKGMVVFNADKTYTYRPNANESGTDSFTFKVNDGKLDSQTATISINILPVNDAPVVKSFTNSTQEDATSGAIGWLYDSASDVETSKYDLTYRITKAPAYGTVAIQSDGYYRYVPNANFKGVDTFEFVASDGMADSNIGTATVTVASVNDWPVAVDVSYVTTEDAIFEGVVLASDIDGDKLSYSATQPRNGELFLSPDGSFTYTPKLNTFGPDSFTFTASDGGDTSFSATVSLYVSAVNDVPVATSNSLLVNEDETATGNVTATDVETESLTYFVVDSPKNGILAFGSDGGYTYTPKVNFNGADSFTFKANDGAADSNVATVAITVKPVNDAPVASSGVVSTQEDHSVRGVLIASDGDAAGDVLTYSVVSSPRDGVLQLDKTTGEFMYTPRLNANGVVSFTYKVNDGTADSNEAVVQIWIDPVNDVPVAANASTKMLVNTVLNGRVPAAKDVDLTDIVSYVQVAGPANGSLVLNSDGSYTYKPKANYSGVDSFTYKANDGTLDSNVAQVTVTVAAVNRAPSAIGSQLSVLEDETFSGALVGSDSDGDTLTYQVVRQPDYGTVILDFGSGNYIYTPTLNFNGVDSFTFKISDGVDESNVAVVSLVVTAVNDAPVALDATAYTKEDVVLNGFLPAAKDVEGELITYAKTADPLHGTVVINSAGDYAYTPTLNYNGTDSFRYSVSDASGGVSVYAVNLTVNPFNDAPVFTGSVNAPEVPLGRAYTYTVPEGLVLDVDGDPLIWSASSSNGSDLPKWLSFDPGSHTFSVVANAVAQGLTQGTYGVQLTASDGVLSSNASFNLTVVDPSVGVVGGLFGIDRDDHLQGTAGNDVFVTGLGNDTVDGGAGQDTVRLPMFPNVFNWAQTGAGQVSAQYDGHTLVLNDVELVQFGTSFQTTLPLSMLLSGTAQEEVTQLTDLYVAFFGRAPDAAGLEFWQKQLLENGLDFGQLAARFADSAEAKALYPANLSNQDFVRSIYLNSFGREPDAAGWDYWGSVLNGVDKNDVVQRGAFIAQVVLGAYAATSGDADLYMLTNKHDAALYYTNKLALQPQEQFDGGVGQLLQMVTGERVTVSKAEAVVDYAFDHSITLTGVLSDPVLLASLW